MSSGQFRLGLMRDDDVCARDECHHRRDEHVRDSRGLTFECMAFGCLCSRFVAGGARVHDTDKDLEAVRPSEREKT